MGNRNDYLKQLNQMRNNYQNSGNPMVNPADDTTNVGEELSSFAYMQTDLPKTETKEKLDDISNRVGDTILGTSMGANVAHGILNWVDDMWDFTVTTLGGAGSFFKSWEEALFGVGEGNTFKERYQNNWNANVNNMQKVIDYEWEAQAENIVNQLNFVGQLVGKNIFDEQTWQDYGEGWRATGSLEKSKQRNAEIETSGLLSQKKILGQTIGNIEQGVGYVLPSIAIAYWTGGTSIAAQAAIQGGVAFGAGMGSGVETATKEGADFGKAVGYGAAKGAISGATTAATVGIGGNIASKAGSGLVGELSGKVGMAVGKKATTEAAQKAITTAVGKSAEILTRAGIASLNAATNTALDPVLKQIYDDDAIENAYGSKVARSETWKKCQSAMTSAAIISIATSVGREGVNVAKAGGFSNYADRYMNQQTQVYAKKYENLSKSMNKELIANKDNPQKCEQIMAKYTNQYNKLVDGYELALTHTEQMAKLSNVDTTNFGKQENIKQSQNILKYVQHTTQGNQAIATKLLENPNFKDYFKASEVNDNQANFYSNDGTKLLTFRDDGKAYLTYKGNTEKTSYTMPVEVSKKGTIKLIVDTEKSLGHALDLIGDKKVKFDTSIYLKKDTLSLPQTLSTKVNNSEGIEIASSEIAKWTEDFKNDIKDYFEVAAENKGKIIYKDENTGKYKVIERYTDSSGKQKVAIITTDKGFKLAENIEITDEKSSPITTQDTEIKIDKSTLVPITKEEEIPMEQRLIPFNDEVNVKIGNDKPYTISDTFIFKSENEDKSLGHQELVNYIEIAKNIPSEETYISKDGKYIYQVAKQTKQVPVEAKNGLTTNRKSPVGKQGNKDWMLKELSPLFPKTDKVDGYFVDAFGGSGVVGLNASYDNIIVNELDKTTHEQLTTFKNTSPKEVVSHVENTIKEFDLTTEEGFNKLVERYNKDKNPLDLYILKQCSSRQQNNNIDENGNYTGHLGLGNSKNFVENKVSKLEKELTNSNYKMQRIDYQNKNALDIIEKSTSDDFLFIDPPYSLTNAEYNTNWTEQDDIKLMEALDKAHERGVKFLLTNSFDYTDKNGNQRTADNWLQWSKKYDTPKVLDKTYNGAKSKEYIVRNYDDNGELIEAKQQTFDVENLSKQDVDNLVKYAFANDGFIAETEDDMRNIIENHITNKNYKALSKFATKEFLRRNGYQVSKEHKQEFKPLAERQKSIDNMYGVIKIDGETHHLSDIDDTVSSIDFYAQEYEDNYSEGNDYVEPYIKKRYVSKVNSCCEKLLDFFKSEVYDPDTSYDFEVDSLDTETIKLVQNADLQSLQSDLETLVGEIGSCEYPNYDDPDCSEIENLIEYLDDFQNGIEEVLNEYENFNAQKQLELENQQNQHQPKEAKAPKTVEQTTYLTYRYDAQTKSLLDLTETKESPNYHLGQNGVVKVSTMTEKDIESSARFITAKGNLEKKTVIGLQQTREVVKGALEYLANRVGGQDGEVKLNGVPARNKEIFTVLNTGSDEQVNQMIDTVLDRLINSEITYNKGTKDQYTVKLRDFAPEQLQIIKEDLGKALKELIELNSEQSKMSKTIDKYEGKLEKQQEYYESKIEKAVDKYNNAIDRFNDYRERHKTSLKLQKQATKIADRIEKEHIYGLSDKDNVIKHNVLKLAKLSTFKDGVYSASNKKNFYALSTDAEFMESLEGDTKLYGNGERVADLIRQIADTYDANADTQKPFTLDELKLVQEFQQESLKAFDYSTKMRDEVYPTSVEIKGQLDFMRDNGVSVYKTNYAKDGVEYISDPSHALIRLVGSRDSKLYEAVYVDGVHCASNVLKDNTVLAKKYQSYPEIQVKLPSKENIVLSNGVSVSQRHLCYLYAQTLVAENKKHLVGKGSIEIGKGKYKRTVDFEFTPQVLEEVEKLTSPEAKAKAQAIIKFLNDDLKPYLVSKGATVVEGEYLTEITNRLIRADNVTKLGGKSYTVKSNNLKERTNNTLPAHITTFEVLIPNLVNSVVTEVNFNNYMIKMNYLLNMDLSEDGQYYTGLSSSIKNLDNNGMPMIKNMMASFVGVDPSKKPEKMPIIDYVVNQTMTAKVGLNFFSTALKQPISIFYAFETLNQKDFWVAMAKGKFFKAFADSVMYNFANGKVSKELQPVFDESGLLMTRGNAAIKGSQLNENGKVNVVSRIAGFNLSLGDMTAISFLTYVSLEQAKAEGLSGDDMYFRAAQLMDIAVQRQVNNYGWNTSRLQHNPVGKFIAAFKSQGRSLVSMVGDLATEIQYVKQVLPKSEKVMEEAKHEIEIAKSKVEHAKTDDEKAQAQKEQSKAEQKYKNAESTNKQAKTTKAKLGKRARAVASALVSSGILMTIIGSYLTPRLYGKKKWTDKIDFSQLGKDFLYNTFVSWIPVVSTITDRFYKDYESPNLIFESLDDIYDVYSGVKKLSDNPSSTQVASLINKIAVITATMFGIPLENVEKQLYGIARNFNIEDMVKFQNLLYGYSSTYLSTQVKEQASSDPKQAKIFLSQNMTLYKTGTSDDKVNAEIIRLYGVDSSYSCIPSDTLTKYKDDSGNTVKLTDKQKQVFKDCYSKSTDSVKEMLELTDYKSQIDQNKAKLIKSVYDAYYQYAKAQALGTTPTTKMSKLLAASNGSIGITKYLIGINALSEIKATNNNTRKSLVINRINQMKNFDKNEKLLLLYLCGYSISDENKVMLVRYLQKNGMSKKEAEDYLS